jgi:hypothetical protein
MVGTERDKPKLGPTSDARELLSWKHWIRREDALYRSASASSALMKVGDRGRLTQYMRDHRLNPDPAYAPASSHLRGKPRYDWARYSGEPGAGYDPLVGYNVRWAERRTQKVAPFSGLRTSSSGNLALARALTPLNIKPVNRADLRRPPRTPPPQPVHRTISLEDLAPEIPERRNRRLPETGLSAGDSSIASIAFSHT